LNRTTSKICLAAILLLISGSKLLAQDAGRDSNVLNNGLLIVGVLVVLAAIVILSENLLKVEAKRNQVDTSSQDTSLFPGLRRLFRPKPPAYVHNKEPFFHLTKGFDIKLEGTAETEIQEIHTSTYAVQPPNFKGIAPIPKMMVEEGAEVLAGDPLFFNRKTPDIYYTAPVSGEVISINRGEKRAITEVVILADRETRFRQFEIPSLDGDRDAIVKLLLESGFWPFINSRPYDVVPDISVIPRDIFISTFDTAPLAADLNFVVAGQETAFQKGLDVLGRLTDGDVHLGLNANAKTAPSAAFTRAEGVRKYWFRGKHPAGNVGVQIHHIKPIRSGDVVWTLGVQDVIMLGRLFLEGKFVAKRRVAVCGENVSHPHYVETYAGAKVDELVQGNLKETENIRLVSGDLLTGTKKDRDQFIDARENELCTATEGRYHELFGWLIPSTARPSTSNTFPNFLFPGAVYGYDTNTHGEFRAFVMTGQYEEVLPMDIYPQHLMKAIMAQDFERMEGLGIYELSEEDVALCEFACTSKQPLQQILREGLDLMREQG
jgi:Na+-transporting NADH:ubiquinone oxidoreductase subunit A